MRVLLATLFACVAFATPIGAHSQQDYCIGFATGGAVTVWTQAVFQALPLAQKQAYWRCMANNPHPPAPEE